MHSATTAIVTGPDGAIWFTDTGTGKILRSDTSGNMTEFPLPAGTVPYDLAVGPEGALWFTEFDQDTIGRITTSGTFTFFHANINLPENIAVGSDGALWFTEPYEYSIGRLTTTGVVHHVCDSEESDGLRHRRWS